MGETEGATYTIYEEELCITSYGRGKRCSRDNACSFIEIR